MRIVNHITIAVAVIVLLAGCQEMLVSTPTLYLDAEQDPFADVPVELRTNAVDLLYATDRLADGERDGSVEYGYDRSRSLAFGSCVVEIGRDVSWEQLVEASRSEKREVSLPLRLASVTELGRFPDTPPPLVVRDGESTETETDAYLAQRGAAFDAFHDVLRDRLAITPRKEVFVFVHGFNNTFEYAAFRLAQLWHFLGREGVPILYSWPAGHPGLVKGYTHDRESGEFTIFHLKELLRVLAACPEVEQVSVISHSRGTDVLSTALRELVIAELAAGRDPEEVFKINNTVFAAPDLDMDVSSQRNAADRLFRIQRRLVIYVSPTDKALGAAEWLFANPNRLGKMQPERMDARTRERFSVIRGGEVIDSRVHAKGSKHAYFVDHPATLSDVILVLRYDRPVGAEHGRPLTEIAPNWFILDDDYPRKAAPLPKSLRKE